MINLKKLYESIVLSGGKSENLSAAKKEIEAKGIPHPWADNETIFQQEGISIELKVWDKKLWLSSIINFGTGRQGNATKILKMILDIAKKYNVPVGLTAVPIKHTPNSISASKLKSWYLKHGFKETNRGYLIFEPN